MEINICLYHGVINEMRIAQVLNTGLGIFQPRPPQLLGGQILGYIRAVAILLTTHEAIWRRPFTNSTRTNP